MNYRYKRPAFSESYTRDDYIDNLLRVLGALTQAIDECVQQKTHRKIADRFAALTKGTKFNEMEEEEDG